MPLHYTAYEESGNGGRGRMGLLRGSAEGLEEDLVIGRCCNFEAVQELNCSVTGVDGRPGWFGQT